MDMLVSSAMLLLLTALRSTYSAAPGHRDIMGGAVGAPPRRARRLELRSASRAVGPPRLPACGKLVARRAEHRAGPPEEEEVKCRILDDHNVINSLETGNGGRPQGGRD